MIKINNSKLKVLLSIALLLTTFYWCESILRKTLGLKLVYPGFTYLAWNYLPLVLVFIMLLAVFNRILLSALLTGSVSLALIAINAKKFENLSKTLIPTDLVLVKQVIGDFSLYAKYINQGATAAAVAIFIGIVAGLLFVEGPLFNNTMKVRSIRAVVAILLAVTAINVTHATSYSQYVLNRSGLTYHEWSPTLTVKKSGFFFNFLKMSGGLSVGIPANYGDVGVIEKKLAENVPASLPKQLPDIIMVQSEAFYDLRRHDLKIGGSAYEGFDKAEEQAVVKGDLLVPTAGGNTIMTEFSVLTGIDMAALPSDCDYPYRYLVKRELWSIAQYLRSIGYRTIMVHPFKRTFWDRNIAMPLLGFDEFIDIRYFSTGMNEGFYVSDMALYDRVVSLTNDQKQSPLFIFVVTMENHGPWNTKRVEHERKIAVSGDLTTDERAMVGRYLHHVVDAGKMALALTQHFQKTTRPTVISFYGDHSPIFPSIFKRVKTRDPKDSVYETPYFIWQNHWAGKTVTKRLNASFLSGSILDVAGINNDDYFRANSYYRGISSGNFDSDAVDDTLKHSYVQLLYNNLKNGLGRATATAAKGGARQLNASASDARIVDFGPKEAVEGVGFNVQPDGSSSVWFKVENAGKNYVIFADDEPLETNLASDGKSMTIIVPRYKIKHPGKIRFCLYDTTHHLCSNDVYFTINERKKDSDSGTKLN